MPAESAWGQNEPPSFVAGGDGTCFDSGRHGSGSLTADPPGGESKGMARAAPVARSAGPGDGRPNRADAYAPAAPIADYFLLHARAAIFDLERSGRLGERSGRLAALIPDTHDPPSCSISDPCTVELTRKQIDEIGASIAAPRFSISDPCTVEITASAPRNPAALKETRDTSGNDMASGGSRQNTPVDARSVEDAPWRAGSQPSDHNHPASPVRRRLIGLP
jgi:hypothetical protein